MNELRWILLVAGLVLIAGIYLWGLRARRRAAAPEHERMTRVEPARVVAVAPEPVYEEPEAIEPEAPSDEPEPMWRDEPDEDFAPRRPAGSVRREPRFEPRPEPRIEPRIESHVETVPRSRAEPSLEPRIEAPATPVMTATRDEPRPAPAAEAPRKPPAQRIVALRVVAAGGAVFEGAQLLEALLADGFVFGRYQIFHRLDDSGRPVVSLASLKEPGTFDPDNMPGMDFRGIALFTVVPGPLPGVRAFDELIVTARALASTLGGQLQDERGAPLTLQRIGQLREEVAAQELARGASPGA